MKILYYFNCHMIALVCIAHILIFSIVTQRCIRLYYIHYIHRFFNLIHLTFLNLLFQLTSKLIFRFYFILFIFCIWTLYKPLVCEWVFVSNWDRQFFFSIRYLKSKLVRKLCVFTSISLWLKFISVTTLDTSLHLLRNWIEYLTIAPITRKENRWIKLYPLILWFFRNCGTTMHPFLPQH